MKQFIAYLVQVYTFAAMVSYAFNASTAEEFVLWLVGAFYVFLCHLNLGTMAKMGEQLKHYNDDMKGYNDVLRATKQALDADDLNVLREYWRARRQP